MANQPAEKIFFQVTEIYDACAGLCVIIFADSPLLYVSDQSTLRCTYMMGQNK